MTPHEPGDSLGRLGELKLHWWALGGQRPAFLCHEHWTMWWNRATDGPFWDKTFLRFCGYPQAFLWERVLWSCAGFYGQLLEPVSEDLVSETYGLFLKLVSSSVVSGLVLKMETIGVCITLPNQHPRSGQPSVAAYNTDCCFFVWKCTTWKKRYG